MGALLMTRPLLLDLFCGAGGAAVGYHRAGFDVIGADINPQPNYPFEFFQDDALATLHRLIEINGGGFDVIHASPPCQAFSSMRVMPDAKKTHSRLIAPVRELLIGIGLPYVIENVAGAPLINPAILCGTMFGLGVEEFQLRRHRLFESSIDLLTEQCRHKGQTIGVYGGHVRCRSTEFWRNGGADFPGYDKKQLAMTAMGIKHFMTMNELSEAIPPAYTEYIGHQLMRQVAV